MEGWGWVDGGVGVGGWMGVGMSRCAPPLLRLRRLHLRYEGNP